MNLPNVLTLLRMVAVPFVVYALLLQTDRGDQVAAALFAVAAITDFVDGAIARRQNIVTRFGKLMDPLADKLLVTSVFITLSVQDRLPLWVTLVVLAREFAVTGLRMLVADDGQVISASRWGKLKTVLQMYAVIAVILFAPATWVTVLVDVMVAVTVLSGVDYFLNISKRTDKPA
ncbi:MAG: CDP-diacylglycerol--glycerol-3-phosphate 3-phosphatidyltransferase [Thermoleophilaceae bacterium]|nr:CDP-diacylglycerol--glycerol-3-phosphate 3-phosphatidyltransferase [Thermoleophilaceae bacterium]